MKKIIILLLCIILSTITCIGQIAPPKGFHYVATIETTMGDITALLYNDTPNHRDNFVKLARSNFYDSVIFHRVINGFMIQCGDPESKKPQPHKQYGDHDVGYTIPAEIKSNHHHFIGALCAAREDDQTNPDRASSGSHFYIVTGGQLTDSTMKRAKNIIEKFGAPELDSAIVDKYMSIGGAPHLDGSYTCFGMVISGMENAIAISQVETDALDRPKQNISIKRIKIKAIKDKAR